MKKQRTQEEYDTLEKYVKELEAKLEKILDTVLLLDENQIDSEAAIEEISDIVWPGRFGS